MSSYLRLCNSEDYAEHMDPRDIAELTDPAGERKLQQEDVQSLSREAEHNIIEEPSHDVFNYPASGRSSPKHHQITGSSTSMASADHINNLRYETRNSTDRSKGNKNLEVLIDIAPLSLGDVEVQSHNKHSPRSGDNRDSDHDSDGHASDGDSAESSGGEASPDLETDVTPRTNPFATARRLSFPMGELSRATSLPSPLARDQKHKALVFGEKSSTARRGLPPLKTMVSPRVCPTDMAQFRSEHAIGTPINARMKQPVKHQQRRKHKHRRGSDAQARGYYGSFEEPLLSQPRQDLFPSHRNRNDSAEPDTTTVMVVGKDMNRDNATMTAEQLGELLDSILKTKLPNPVWIDLEGTPQAVVAMVGAKLALHSLTIEDCTHFEEDMRHSNYAATEREKMELFRNHQYCYIQYHALPMVDFTTDEEIPVKLLVFKNLLFTLHHSPLECLQHIAPKLQGYVADLSWLVYNIIKAISHQFFLAVDQVLREVDTLDHLVNVLTQGEMADFLLRVRVARRGMVRLQMSLSAKRRIINSMSKEAGAEQFFPNLHYLHDLFDQLSVMLTRLEYADEMLQSTQDAYTSLTSLNVSLYANATNDIMKKLTSVATLILPLSLVAGLWGMNVKLPGDNPEHGYWPFAIILGCCILVVVTGGWFLKQKKLL